MQFSIKILVLIIIYKKESNYRLDTYYILIIYYMKINNINKGEEDNNKINVL